jgi:hypothetical protein
VSVRDLISAVVVFVFSGAAFYMAGDYGTKAGMFPRLVSGIMMAAAVLLFIRGMFFRPQGTDVDQVAMRRMGVAIVLTLLYIAAIVPVGYITSSIVFLMVTTYLLGMRRYLLTGIVTVLFVFCLHYVFEHIFHSPLPGELVLRLF